jgi:hypothetical protein
MTTGQEIAFAVYGDIDHELGKVIDKAIAEAVSKRTVECAKTCVKRCRSLYQGVSASEIELSKAILALNTPAPAYPFGKDAMGRQCECWRICNGHYERWTDNGTVVFNIHQQACQWCGAARTEGI